jgi:hypothetical protein
VLTLLEPVDELIGRAADHACKREIVYIALFQGGEGDSGVWDHLDDDAVEIGSPLEVVLVGFEDHVVSPYPLREFPGS